MLGFLNVAKPTGITAHDVVGRLRRASKIKYIGHGGTLDPMATGVLPIAIGNACRLIRFLPDDKTYLAEILFGQTTTTDDIEGEVLTTSTEIPTQEQIIGFLPKFQGAIEQIPPMYSAIHVKGKRLYELARQGKTPESIPVRHVTIFQIEFIEYNAPVLKLRIHCSAGTYIRSIARDLGEMLACGGCLCSLKREKAGKFDISEAKELSELEAEIRQGSLEKLLIAPELILPFSNIELTDAQADHIRHGRIAHATLAQASSISEYCLVSYQKSVLALCRTNDLSAGDTSEKQRTIALKPELVLNNG